MKKIVFFLFFIFLLNSCSIDLSWENTKQIINTINNKKETPSCTSVYNNTTLTCVWSDWTCKSLYTAKIGRTDFSDDWKNCWNALNSN